MLHEILDIFPVLSDQVYIRNVLSAIVRNWWEMRKQSRDSTAMNNVEGEGVHKIAGILVSVMRFELGSFTV